MVKKKSTVKVNVFQVKTGKGKGKWTWVTSIPDEEGSFSFISGKHYKEKRYAKEAAKKCIGAMSNLDGQGASVDFNVEFKINGEPIDIIDFMRNEP